MGYLANGEPCLGLVIMDLGMPGIGVAKALKAILEVNQTAALAARGQFPMQTVADRLGV